MKPKPLKKRKPAKKVWLVNTLAEGWANYY
jgi:hypothetical protein